MADEDPGGLCTDDPVRNLPDPGVVVSTILTLAGGFVAGLAWWSLLEYLLHRHLFHRFPRSMGRRHIQHHARPRERRLAVAPLPSSVGGIALHGLLFLGLFGPELGGALLAGLVAGYLAYEWVHWSAHYRAPKHRWMRALRRHHLLHHHRDPDARFGVTTPAWDWLLGTLPPLPVRTAGGAAGGGRSHLPR